MAFSLAQMQAYLAFELTIANTLRTLNTAVVPSSDTAQYVADQTARLRSAAIQIQGSAIMALSPTDIANLLDLERQLFAQLQSSNKSVPPEQNPMLYLATEISRRRVTALNVLNGTDTTAPVISPPTISPRSGSAGQTYTGTDGVVSSGKFVGRRWLLDGSPLGTGQTVVPDGPGLLSFVTDALGPTGYPGSASSIGVQVSVATPFTFTMTQLPSPNRVYQRTSTTGGAQNVGSGSIQGSVPLQSAGSLYYRIRGDDGGTVQGPVLLQNLPAGQQVLTIPVDARLSWLYVDMSSDGQIWQRGSVPFAIGRVIALSGQSLAVRKFAVQTDTKNTLAVLGIRPGKYGVVYATYEDNRSMLSPAWQVPADGTIYDSSHAAIFLQYEVNAAKVPCALVGHAHGGKWIGWFKPGAEDNAKLRTVLAAVGGWEVFIWDHGHSDSSAYGPDYINNLNAVIQDVTSYNAIRGSNFLIVIDTVPTITKDYGPNTALNNIRKTMEQWANQNNAPFCCAVDVDVEDGVHPTQAAGFATARHDFRATRPQLGLSGGDIGPRLASGYRPSYSGQIVINMSMAAGAKLVSVGSPATRFKVAPSGTTNWINVASMTVADQSVTLTLASLPDNATALDVYWAYPYDASLQGSANMIWDNVIDGDGITIGRQLMPNFNPLVIAAPGG